MRSFVDDLMRDASKTRPAICERIQQTRRALFVEWRASHPGTDNPYSQENVARRVGVTLGGYGGWERHVEPNLSRLRQIAVALNLDEDYFLPSGDLASATARVEAEADRLAGIGGQLEVLVEALARALGEEESAQSQSEPE